MAVSSSWKGIPSFWRYMWYQTCFAQPLEQVLWFSGKYCSDTADAIIMENDSFNSTDQIPIDNLATTVGILYLCIGVIFIFLHVTCAYLIYTDKEMQNPTYKFVINLSVCDTLELIALGLYLGTIVLLNDKNATLDRWMSFISMTCWYVNCSLSMLISFSRWIAITKSHMVSRVFR